MSRRTPDVLILTQREDATADFLIPYLDRQALSWLRWDPGELPNETLAGISLTPGGTATLRIETESRAVAFDDVGVIWYRRPGVHYAPAAVPTQAVGAFIDQECAHLVANFWRCSDRPIVNDPILGHVASQKLLQLRVAAALGFEVPMTYMGNDPTAIRALWESSSGQMVVKAFRAASVDTGATGHKSTYTTRVRAEDLDDDAVLRACPSIWQQRIDKRADIRVTVIGERVFAAEIQSEVAQPGNDDWRCLLPSQVNQVRHDLPPEIAQRCIHLIRRFGLFFGAIDLVLTARGRYVFLENNPFGQWAWLQEQCGLPLAEAFCLLFEDLARGAGELRRAPSDGDFAVAAPVSVSASRENRSAEAR